MPKSSWVFVSCSYSCLAVICYPFGLLCSLNWSVICRSLVVDFCFVRNVFVFVCWHRSLPWLILRLTWSWNWKNRFWTGPRKDFIVICQPASSWTQPLPYLLACYPIYSCELIDFSLPPSPPIFLYLCFLLRVSWEFSGGGGAGIIGRLLKVFTLLHQNVSLQLKFLFQKLTKKGGNGVLSLFLRSTVV